MRYNQNLILLNRESLVFNKEQPNEVTWDTLEQGDIVHGYVNKVVEKVGVFVNLSREVQARVNFSALSDDYVTNVATKYPPGNISNNNMMRLYIIAFNYNNSIFLQENL
jgi:ribosomal protein S1